MRKNEEKLNAEKEKIKQHFKKERKKVTAIFLIFEVVAIVAAWLLTGLVYIHWFLVALFFIVVFPTTQYSKKQKELTKAEATQLGFSEQEY